MDPDNLKNQVCITMVFMVLIGIWFILSIIQTTNACCLALAFNRQWMKCFGGLTCFSNIVGLVGFITFILASIARWSEAGRACSGEFLDEHIDYFNGIAAD